MAAQAWLLCSLVKDGQSEQVVAWGPLPTSLPVQRRIARAELFAVLMVLRACLPPVRVHVDCLLILKGIARGVKWCTFSKRPHADVWREIWKALSDIGIGESGAGFFKVQAHLAKARIAEELEPVRRMLEANAAADKWAKEEAASGTNVMLHFVAQAVSDQAERVKGALDLIADLAEQVLAKHEAWPDVDPLQQGGKGVSRPRRESQVRQHDWMAKSFGQQCRRCYRVAGSDDRKTTLDKVGCGGHAVTKLMLDDIGPQVVVNGHRLWQTGPYVWCAQCGSHTHLRVKALAKRCKGGRCVAGARARRENLRAGRAPNAGPGDEQLGAPLRLTLVTWLEWTGFVLAEGEDGAARLSELLEAQAVVGDVEEEAA